MEKEKSTKRKEVMISILAVFNRCGSHIFTKQEQSDLLADKKITFDGISKKNGKTYKYTVTGKLGYKTFKGNKFVEFKPKFN